MPTKDKPLAKRPAHLWKPGQSGNPSGLKKGTKNHITVLKRELELAIRDHINPQAIKDVLGAMVDEARKGNVGAGKLILDKFVSNAKDGEEDNSASGTFIFKIDNITLKDIRPEDDPVTLDITPTQET